jgi:hypothetical protein
LEAIIEEEHFYPVTMLREVDRTIEAALGDNDILLLKQLVDTDLEKTSIKTGIKKNKT